MNKQRKKRLGEIREHVESKMDARDELYKYLQIWFDKYGEIPRQFIADWNAYQTDLQRGRYPWRQSYRIRRMVDKTVRRLEKNEHQKPADKTQRAEQYLSKQLRKIHRS